MLCLLLSSGKLTAQVFLNLDFEYSVYNAQPRKWAIEGEGESYDAKVDSTTAKSGHKSLHVTVTNGGVYTFLWIPGRTIAGKTVRVESYIRFRNADSLMTMLAFRDPDGGRPNTSQPIKGNNADWNLATYQASFPENYSSDRLLVALVARGTGEFWMDNVKIEIDGQDYGNGTPDFKEPTAKEIALLDKAAVEIKVTNTGLDDLVPVGKMIGNARIVALGENSHGSSTIYRFKLRMVKFLVEKKKFSIFALEMPAMEAGRINGYVLKDTGTVDNVLKDLTYPSWQTQEMVDIIQWIRSYNITTDKKVEFKGFDSQNSSRALQDRSGKEESRDQYMAENIEQLAEDNVGKKMILSADNTHVTKASGKMGDFLSRRYGKSYLAVGFTFNNGSYSAYGPKKYYDVHPSYAGTYEYLFSKSRFKNFLLDLRTINDIPILDRMAGFRSIGSRPQETTQFTEIEIKKNFDLIVYLDNSVHTSSAMHTLPLVYQPNALASRYRCLALHRRHVDDKSIFHKQKTGMPPFAYRNAN